MLGKGGWILNEGSFAWELSNPRTLKPIKVRGQLKLFHIADRLIVLDEGEIVEMGTHAELMEKQGEFYKLVETQSHATQIIAVAG